MAASPRPPQVPATWAFQPVVRPAVPGVRDAGWPRTAADRFILAALEARGWTPSPETTRADMLAAVGQTFLGISQAEVLAGRISRAM